MFWVRLPAVVACTVMRSAALVPVLVFGFVACTDASSGGGGAGPVEDDVAQAPDCNNGERDGDEAGIDCGGSCGPCADVGPGQDVCEDCDLCTNGVQDDGEAGVDCGGACPSVCVEVATCTDGLVNGDESDVDCGGACGACGVGKACRLWSDCASETCLAGTCAAVVDPCLDGLRDGAETDIDCGGGVCAPCDDGDACKLDSDCAASPCVKGLCAPPTCADTISNGAETDVDCGGPACKPCGPGFACLAHDDCDNSDCDLGACADCDDGRVNGAESHVDCGGPVCSPCGVGSPCKAPGDCAAPLLCADQTCCTPNACGACGQLPAESCNGVDDDCDGATDEELTPTPCPIQAGECEGAVAQCKGTSGWQCGSAAYTAAGDYESVETSCDGLDNDCDQITDEGECGACEAGPAVLAGFSAFGDLRFGGDFFAWDSTEGASGPVVVASGLDGDGIRRLLVGDSQGVLPVSGTGSAAPSLHLGPEGRFVSHLSNGDLALINLEEPLVPFHVRTVGATTALPLSVRGEAIAVGFTAGDGFLRVDLGTGLDAEGTWSVADLGLSSDVSGLALALTESGTLHALWRQGGTLVHGNPLGVPYVVDAELTGPADLALAEDGGLYVAYVRDAHVLLRRRDPSWQWFGETVAGVDAVSEAVAVTLDVYGARYVAFSAGSGSVSLARVSQLGPEPLGVWPLGVDGEVLRLDLEAGPEGVFRLAAIVQGAEGLQVVVVSLCPG